MFREIKHKRPLFFYRRPYTCSTEDKIKGRTIFSHHLTIHDKHTNGYGKFTSPPPISPSPSHPSLPTLSQSVLRFTTLHAEKEKKSFIRIWGHTWEINVRFLLLQTPPSFEPYLPSKVLFLISLEHHSRPNSKRNHCLCRIPVLTWWQISESGKYRPPQ